MSACSAAERYVEFDGNAKIVARVHAVKHKAYLQAPLYAAPIELA